MDSICPVCYSSIPSVGSIIFIVFMMMGAIFGLLTLVPSFHSRLASYIALLLSKVFSPSLTSASFPQRDNLDPGSLSIPADAPAVVAILRLVVLLSIGLLVGLAAWAGREAYCQNSAERIEVPTVEGTVFTLSIVGSRRRCPGGIYLTPSSTRHTYTMTARGGSHHQKWWTFRLTYSNNVGIVEVSRSPRDAPSLTVGDNTEGPHKILLITPAPPQTDGGIPGIPLPRVTDAGIVDANSLPSPPCLDCFPLPPRHRRDAGPADRPRVDVPSAPPFRDAGPPDRPVMDVPSPPPFSRDAGSPVRPVADVPIPPCCRIPDTLDAGLQRRDAGSRDARTLDFDSAQGRIDLNNASYDDLLAGIEPRLRSRGCSAGAEVRALCNRLISISRNGATGALAGDPERACTLLRRFTSWPCNYIYECGPCSPSNVH